MNDCAPNEADDGPRVALDEALANADAVIGEASSWLPTLVFGPPPVAELDAHNDRIVGLSAGLSEVCAQLRTPFISAVAVAKFHGLWRAEAAAGDGVHPNRGGYAALAELVATSAVWRSWLAS